MSFSAFVRVAKLRGLTAPKKLVMCCLSDFSDDNGIAYPSIELISEWSGLNRKTVMKTIKELIADGLIDCRKSLGAKSIYRLSYEAIESSTEIDTGAVFGTSPKNGQKAVPNLDKKQYQNWDANQLRTSQEPDMRSETVNPTPPAEPKKPEKKPKILVTVFRPEEVSEESWSAWMQVRKAKRAPQLNSIAWNRFQNEARKAGLTLQQAVTICAAKEWRGFEAEWLKKDGSGFGAVAPAQQAGGSLFGSFSK